MSPFSRTPIAGKPLPVDADVSAAHPRDGGNLAGRSGRIPTVLPRPLSRRALLGAGLLGAPLAGAAGAWAAWRSELDVSTERRTFALPGLPQELRGLRLAFLTDLHCGPQTDPQTLEQALRAASEFEPDIVLYGGDFVQWDPGEIAPLLPLIRSLRAPLGCWGVLGNHDFADPARLARELESVGVELLTNRVAQIAEGLVVGGIDDVSLGQPDPNRLGNVRGDNTAVVLLSHNPAGSRLLGNRQALVLSGHTHGGQVLIPGVAPHRAPDLDDFPVLQGFVLERGNGVYVSRGIGNTALPVRFRCPPEVLLATLVPGGRKAECRRPELT